MASMNTPENMSVIEPTFEDGFWDPNMFPLPLSGSIEFDGDYQTIPMGMNYPVSFLQTERLNNSKAY